MSKKLCVDSHFIKSMICEIIEDLHQDTRVKTLEKLGIYLEIFYDFDETYWNKYSKEENTEKDGEKLYYIG